MKKIVFIIVCALVCGCALHQFKEDNPKTYDAIISVSSKALHKGGEIVSRINWKQGFDIIYDKSTTFCYDIWDGGKKLVGKADTTLQNGCHKADRYIKREVHKITEEKNVSNEDNSISNEMKYVSTDASQKLYKVKYSLHQNGYTNNVTTITMGKPKVMRDKNMWVITYKFPSGVGYYISTDQKIIINEINEI